VLKQALRRLELVDVLTIGFMCINIVFILAVRSSIDAPWQILGGYLVCLGIAALIVTVGGPERYQVPRSRTMRVARWLQGVLRQGYPLTFFAFFFVAVTRFDTALFKSDLDPYFAAMDTFLFGSVPSSWLMIQYPSFLLSELLHFAYVAYYASIPALALWLYVKNKPAFSEFITVAMFLFYATCLTYLVLPVVGGRFDPAVRVLTETYRFGPFTRIMAFIYRSSGHSGAAFPSTHVIVSIVMALTARKYAKPLALPLAIIAALVVVATVYCGYHYVVDVIAAFAYLVVLYPVGLKLHATFHRQQLEAMISSSDAA